MPNTAQTDDRTDLMCHRRSRYSPVAAGARTGSKSQVGRGVLTAPYLPCPNNHLSVALRCNGLQRFENCENASNYVYWCTNSPHWQGCTTDGHNNPPIYMRNSQTALD